MEKKTLITGSAALALALFVVLLLGSYVGGYFWLGEVTSVERQVENAPSIYLGEFRIYRYTWLEKIYKPMAWAETRWCGKKIGTRTQENEWFFDP
jgi:hypothetical protein